MGSEAIDNILSRRSTRRYNDRTIEAAALETMLKAAMSAPSAHNQQPWAFVVIDDRKILDSIPEFHPYSKMLYQAPAAIVVCGDLRELPAPYFWQQDCAAATQNILLAANALGIGSVWLGVFPHEELVTKVQELLGIPGDIKPFSIISLGYPSEGKGPSNRFAPERIHHNGW